jgi:hypothetical protein
MKQRSPTVEGFHAIFRIPSLGLAEIAWRWSFAVAVGALLIFAALQFLDTLPVTSGDLALLRTRQPALISRAALHIFHGSAPRAIAATIVTLLFTAIAWIVVASLGRVAGIKVLLDYFHAGRNSLQTSPASLLPARGWQLGSVMGLNFFRVAITLAAIIGCLGALLLAGSASSEKNPSPGIAALVFFMAVLLITMAWSILNWFLSLGVIFAIEEGRDTFGALASAIDLFRLRSGPVLAVSTWFGLAHIGVLSLFSSLAMVPVALAGALRAKAVLFAVLVVALLYFGVVDFLRMGRFAAYVHIALGPDAAPLVYAPEPSGGPQSVARSDTRVDQDEPILSDLPLTQIPSEN